jgi:hypothetical protein
MAAQSYGSKPKTNAKRKNTAKGKEAADKVSGMRYSLAAAVDDSIGNWPYTMLALTLAAGFAAGAIWKR